MCLCLSTFVYLYLLIGNLLVILEETLICMNTENKTLNHPKIPTK